MLSAVSTDTLTKSGTMCLVSKVYRSVLISEKGFPASSNTRHSFFTFSAKVLFYTWNLFMVFVVKFGPIEWGVFWQNSCCLRACNTLSSQCFVLICDANDSSITLHHCIQLFVNLIMCHGWKLVSCLLSDKITFHELFICVLAVLFKIKKFENMYSQPSWVIVMEVTVIILYFSIELIH